MHFLQVLLAPAADYREQEAPECGHNQDRYADVIRRRVRFSKSIANHDFRQCESWKYHSDASRVCPRDAIAAIIRQWDSKIWGTSECSPIA